jgi:hypothetical protein
MRRPSLRFPSIRRGRSAAGAAGALVVVVVGVILIVSAGSPSQSKGASPSHGVSGATTVQYRNLIATDTESGTLSYANPQTVYNRESGTITWLPQVGAIVKPGGTLFDVDNAPVILFDGTTPAYRDLDSSDTDGPDILELNRDLKQMGFDPDHEISVDNAWQTGTTDAVDRWQESLGATETGDITLGQIVFLPGRQEIDTLDTTVGSTGASSGGGSGDTSYEVGSAHAEFVSDTIGSDTGATGATGATGDASDVAARDAAASCNGLDVQATDPTTNSTKKSTNETDSAGDAAALPSCNQKGTTGPQGTTGTTGATGKGPSQEAVLLALLKAETLELKKSLASSGTGGRTGTGGTGASTGGSGGSFTGGSGGGSESAGSGASASGGSGSSGASSGGSTASAILQTSSTDVIVSVDLDATKQSEAKVGERVSVEMPAGNTVEGKITVVSPIAQSSSSGSTGSGSSGSSGSGSSGSGSSGSGSSATIPVTIALLSHHLPTTGLDQAAVSVNFEQQVENHVLSVPVTALLATNGGGYAVQEAASPHKLIPVTPGLFAAGDVQISGSGIYTGLQVTDSQG